MKKVLPKKAVGQCQLCQDSEEPCIQVPHYKLMICTKCKATNQLGWQVEHELVLREGLHRSGLFIPDRTPEGLLPYDYQPPSDHAL